MQREARMRILNMTVAIRKRLQEDILAQLEGTYGIGRDGRFEPIESMPTMIKNQVLARERQDLEAAIAHELSADPTVGSGKPTQEQWAAAVERFAREIAFTYLNRLAALRMMEARKLIPESVGRGMDSSGFRTFQMPFRTVTPTEEEGYRLYLELLFDEASVELPVLFDRSTPASIIFPSPAALKDALAELNRPDLAEIWLEDETIGWIYQYFTPKEQREQARKESNAPRNSYELSFRNQFYTPAYVVRFLTDNTLGRLWYEMKPNTQLVERCTYMIVRPGEQVPPRLKRSPTEIRVLDPACGSGHFLLYAFDVLAAIYEEEGYPRAEIPGLILEHNLFGIDIDPRAVQIASLALYLKAKKYHPEAKVTSVNVVCAEPMPGDAALFNEFLEALDSAVLRRLAEAVWGEMKLAGEAGSLLKVEQTLSRLIEDERQEWQKGPFATALPGVSGDHLVEDAEAFWDEVEDRLLALLRQYAAHTQDGKYVSRRLFARDGAQGLRFLELLRQKYDVVLMNPPFGAATKLSKAYIEKNYPRTKNDLYAAFVERGLELLRKGGKLGAITSRTGFFLTSFQKWREEILLKKARPTVVADLGAGVLDTAMVETAAYCLEVVE